MSRRRTTITYRSKHEATPVKIVADAAVATKALGDGRLIPLVIVDTSDRPDIDELVRVHEHLSPGDVACQWAQRGRDQDKISLMLEFQRPVELTVILEFDIEQQGGLVDHILAARALYIQPGRQGDRLATKMDHPSHTRGDRGDGIPARVGAHAAKEYYPTLSTKRPQSFAGKTSCSSSRGEVADAHESSN